MLESVKKLGIRVIQTRFVDLEFFQNNVVVYTESLPIKGDVVVGAWGWMMEHYDLQRVTGYRPPDALSAIVTKYHPGKRAWQNSVPIFMPFYLAIPDRVWRDYAERQSPDH